MFDERACYDRDNDISGTFVGDDINMNIDINTQGPIMGDATMNNNSMSQPMMGASQAMPGTISQPIIEPMRERVINRTIMHEVPHICPLRTKIINNHVYRHTYTPSYSCCEENTCTTIQCGSCCNFN